MSGEIESVIEGLRKPEYTGTNRCMPCTLVNLAIAAIVTVAIGVVSVVVAVAFAVVALAAIYLRGYLVPGTPQLTKRYLPDRIHRRFDQHPAAPEYVQPDGGTSGDGEPEFKTVEKVRYHKENRIVIEDYLLENGVIAFDEEAEDIHLTEAFFDRHDREYDALDADAVGLGDIGELFDEAVEEVEDEERDYPAYTVGFRVRKWPSEPALLADLASEAAMRSFADDWLEVPVEHRAKIREALRYLRDTCPACGEGTIIFTDDTVDSCCGTWEVVAAKCDACDVHYNEFDPTELGHKGEHGMTPYY
ncbi:MAG: hypothetical protein ACLFMX_02530 [Halobacteriales archaeon]